MNEERGYCNFLPWSLRAPLHSLMKESGVARIYISSTFGDLTECREAVYQALRAMGHDVIAREHYVPADECPLDKCPVDVAPCDLYVGRFSI